MNAPSEHLRLDPVDADRVAQVRNLADHLGSALAMPQERARLAEHRNRIDLALQAGGEPDELAHITMLLVPLLGQAVRAQACSMIGTGPEALPHLRVWTWVTRHTLDAPPEGLPLTVAGYAAARAGKRETALAAFDRALARIPGLPDAATYRAAVAEGIDPGKLRPCYPPVSGGA